MWRVYSGGAHRNTLEVPRSRFVQPEVADTMSHYFDSTRLNPLSWAYKQKIEAYEVCWAVESPKERENICLRSWASLFTRAKRESIWAASSPTVLWIGVSPATPTMPERKYGGARFEKAQRKISTGPIERQGWTNQRRKNSNKKPTCSKGRRRAGASKRKIACFQLGRNEHFVFSYQPEEKRPNRFVWPASNITSLNVQLFYGD